MEEVYIRVDELIDGKIKDNRETFEKIKEKIEKRVKFEPVRREEIAVYGLDFGLEEEFGERGLRKYIKKFTTIRKEYRKKYFTKWYNYSSYLVIKAGSKVAVFEGRSRDVMFVREAVYSLLADKCAYASEELEKEAESSYRKRKIVRFGIPAAAILAGVIFSTLPYGIFELPAFLIYATYMYVNLNGYTFKRKKSALEIELEKITQQSRSLPGF